MRLRLLFICGMTTFLLGLDTSSAQAAVPPTTRTCSVPLMYPTIQGALDDTTCRTIRISALTPVYYEHLHIRRNVTLTGSTTTAPIIDGSGTGSVITTTSVRYPIQVTLKNIVIRNGAATKGGGIYAQKTNLTLTDVTLESNTATYGGGIFVKDYPLTATNATFSNNVATGSGGGLYMDNAPAVSITGSTFTTNTARNEGGGAAIDMVGDDWSTTDTITITDTTFTENASTSGNGGGLYLVAMDNDLDDPTRQTVYQGIHQVTTLDGDTFSENTAYYSGAGAYLYGFYQLALSDCTFEHNRAEVFGGGAYISSIYDSGAAVSISDSTFDKNIAADTGGGLHYDGYTFTVTGTDFTNNQAVNAHAMDAIAWSNLLTFTDGTVSSNNSLTDEPASYAVELSAVNIDLKNMDFTANSGSAVSLSFDEIANVDTATFENNGNIAIFAAPPLLGTIDTQLLISNSQFVSNSRGVYTSLNGSVVIDTSTFANNFSESGGAPTADIQAETITINNSTFEENRGSTLGSLQLNGTTTTITDSTITGNSATDGGGLYISGDTLTVSDSTISDNTAYVGGGIFSEAGNATFQNVTLSNNTAGYGGGAYIENFANLTITDSAIESNTTTTTSGRGGGLYLKDGTGDATIARTTVAENTGYMGGGMYIDNDDSAITINLENDTIANNTTKDAGSAIVFDSSDGNLILNNTTVANNTMEATWAFYLGTIYLFSGTLTMNNSIMANNNGKQCYYTTRSAVTFTSAGHNISSDTSCGLTATGDQESTDPELQTLDYYGSSTLRTMPPATTDSPAIDAGDNDSCATTDELGTSRPQDDDGDGTATCDVGAIEGVL